MAECLNTVPVYGYSTEAVPGWTGGARSRISFGGDCFFGWRTPRSTVGAIIGLNTDTDATTELQEIKHGFWFQRGEVRIIEGGTLITSFAPFVEGDRFYVVRASNEVYYCRRPITAPEAFYAYPGTDYRFPGEVLRKSSRLSSGEAFLDVTLFATGDFVTDEIAGEVWFSADDEAASLPTGTSSAGGGSLSFIGAASTRPDADPPVGGVIDGSFSVDGSFLSDFNDPDSNLVTGGISAEQGGGGDVVFLLTATTSDEDDPVFEPTTGAIGRGELEFALDAGSGFFTSLTGIAGYLQVQLAANVRAGEEGLADGELTLALDAATRPDADPAITSGGGGELLLVGTGETQATEVDYLFISFRFTGDADGPTPPISDFDLLDSAFMGSMAEVRYAARLADRLRLVTATQTFLLQEAVAQSTMVVGDAVRNAVAVNFADAIGVAGEIRFLQAVNVAERLLAEGAVQTFYEAVVEVMAYLRAVDQAVTAVAAVASDAMFASDTLRLTYQQLVQLVDAMALDDSVDVQLTIFVEETAQMTLADGVELSAQYMAELLERARVFGLIKTNSEIVQGWVMNTEGALPISEYGNFAYNSLAYDGDVFAGASDGGIYLLDGDTDDGADITAEISSMMLDFASSAQKRVRSAYLGYKADGKLILKVRSVQDGQLSEHWYEGKLRQDAPGTDYVKVGQGLKSRYWQFELTNVDGADFEIDQLELHPIFLGRRV